MDLKQFLNDIRAMFGYDIKADTIEDAKRQLDEKIKGDGAAKNRVDGKSVKREITISAPVTINKEKRSVECVIATEKPVLRYDWDDGFFEEVLLMDGCRLADVPGGELPLVNAHRAFSGIENQLGTTAGLRIDGDTLIATRVFSSTAQKAFVMTTEGHLKRQSIGYSISGYSSVKPGETVTLPSGKTITNDGSRTRRYVTSWLPLEDSIVILPADPTTGIRSAENTDPNQPDPKTTNARKGTSMNKFLQQYLRRKFNLANDATEEAITARMNADGLTLEQAEAEFERSIVTPQEDGSKQATAAERARITEISTLCRDLGVEDAKATEFINGEKSLDEVRKAVLEIVAKRNRDNAPPAVGTTTITRDQSDKIVPIITQGILLRAGVIAADAKTPNEARQISSMRMTDVTRYVLEMSGKRASMTLGAETLFHRAMATTDFPKVLSNTVQASLLAGYAERKETYPLWCDMRGRVSDFRSQTFARMLHNYTLKEVKEGEEYQYQYAGEDSDMVAVAKYGIKTAYTWEAMINDYLDQLTEIPQAFGRAARKLEGDMAYDILIDNPDDRDGKAIFHADHGNLDATGAAPNEASLNAAIVAMATQTGSDGSALSIDPEFIIGPKSLSMTIAKLIGSLQHTDGTPGSTQINTVYNALNQIYDARLDAAFAAGNGVWPWFLAAKNAVKFFYLSGYESVSIESKEDFDTDAFTIKCRHIVAAKGMGWPLLYKNVGASLAPAE